MKNEVDGKMKVEGPFGEGKDEAEPQRTLVGDEADDSLRKRRLDRRVRGFVR